MENVVAEHAEDICFSNDPAVGVSRDCLDGIIANLRRTFSKIVAQRTGLGNW